jgi:serine protease AprX
MRIVKQLLSVAMAFVLMLGLFLPGNTNAMQVSNTNGVAMIDPMLAEEMETNTGLIEVIVTFHGNGAPTADQLYLLTSLGIDTGITMHSLPMAGVLATADQIISLSQDGNVRSLYLNREVELYNEDSKDLTGVTKVRTDNDMRVANGGLPVSGKGIGVVVNDSGVDGTHPDLELGENLVQNVLGTTNLDGVASSENYSLRGLFPVTYTEGVANTDTNSGHGTHVAGTVGGTGIMSGGKYAGVAPGANLIGYGSGGVLYILDVLGGFDYAITHQFKYDIRVITNSWGGGGAFDPNDPINVATYACYERGMVILFAAGNSGPGENTHNPYAKAPWVISVGNGQKDAIIKDSSSRGTKGVGGTVEMNGKSYTWKDEPTITAPGTDIISTKALSPLGALSTSKDAALDPAHVPFYGHMSGTSMATPHVAGIVALMLEANPLLSPDEVKNILVKTATNMPGHESWEVGAGYVNAYLAVDNAFNPEKQYGATVNSERTFNTAVDTSKEYEQFTLDYVPGLTDEKKITVTEDTTEIFASMDAVGVFGQTGNTIRLVLVDPNGKEYKTGISLLFPIYTDHVVSVTLPTPGEWTVKVEGLYDAGLPEKLNVTWNTKKAAVELSDIAGHPAEIEIVKGVSERLYDGKTDGKFYPNKALAKQDLAEYLVMGAGIRQQLLSETPFVDAVIAKGSALKGRTIDNAVMDLSVYGAIDNSTVTRAQLAYSLVQSLGEQEKATSFTGDVTVDFKGEKIVIEDAHEIPAELKGYVQRALKLGLMNADFYMEQGPYDLQPTIHATFSPNKAVLRGDFAVYMNKFLTRYLYPNVEDDEE